MAQKVDKNFVQFVKSKHHKKHEDDDEDEPKQSKIFSKKKNELSNYLICEKTAKPNEESEGQSIGNWLKENGKKVIVDKYKPNKHILKAKEDESDEENESDSDESDDYEGETINHFISNKRERDDDSEEAELETLQEMKYLSKKNEGGSIDNDDGDDSDQYEDKEDEKDDDDEEEEDEPEPEIKPKPKQHQQKGKSPKKEFKTNISNTVFISNFPKTFTETDLEKHFLKFGDITTIRLMKTKEGESKGFGYVDYESRKGMKTAIGANLRIKGNEIKIEEAKSSYINIPTDSKKTTQKRLGRKKQKALRNKEKEAKRQLHREKRRQNE